MISLKLTRRYKSPEYTIGTLYINGKYFCDTLEDTDRGLSYTMSLSEISQKKIHGKTAIPTGVYKIIMNIVSSRFKNSIWAKPYKGMVPRLSEVPGFDGVLIHPGNSAKDTEGCILVGQNKVKGGIVHSADTWKKLMEELIKDKENITLTIN